jgi:hypothetical protein
LGGQHLCKWHQPLRPDRQLAVRTLVLYTLIQNRNAHLSNAVELVELLILNFSLSIITDKYPVSHPAV